MDGHPGALADEVPQRLFDAAHRAVVVHAAAASGEVVVGGVRELADARRVAADQVAAERIDVRRDLPVAVALGVALAPAVDAFVRVDAHEAEVLAGARMDKVVP